MRWSNCGVPPLLGLLMLCLISVSTINTGFANDYFLLADAPQVSARVNPLELASDGMPDYSLLGRQVDVSYIPDDFLGVEKQGADTFRVEPYVHERDREEPNAPDELPDQQALIAGPLPDPAPIPLPADQPTLVTHTASAGACSAGSCNAGSYSGGYSRGVFRGGGLFSGPVFRGRLFGGRLRGERAGLFRFRGC